MPTEPTPAPPQSSGRRYLGIAIKIVVSLVLMRVLFSLAHVDVSRLWQSTRAASPAWIAAALGIFAVNVLASTWRWHLLLEAQQVHIPPRRLLGSFLVASFFNNFLPSNIGGDVVRIGDTAGPARSKTLATMIVFVDRVLGLMGLILVAAVGATMAVVKNQGGAGSAAASPVWPTWLWAGFIGCAAVMAPAVLAPNVLARLLKPLTILHPERIGSALETLTSGLGRFRDRPGALVGTFAGAVFVQATMVVFYLAIVYALRIPIGLWDLSVIVPISFVVQMLPISVNGFGVREGIFTLYFHRLGLPTDSAVLLPLLATFLTMLFSLSGAAVYAARHGR